jgi:transcription elongation GreA/GreB family factor
LLHFCIFGYLSGKIESMTQVKPDLTLKKRVIEAFKAHKLEVLDDFRQEERSRLDQVANEDMDNRHIDSKNEETLREMDFLTHSMEIVEKEIYILNSIDTAEEMNEVGFGALVQTDKVMVLVGSAQERMDFDGQSIVGISMASPLMRAMEGKKEGEVVKVGTVSHRIEKIV